MRGRQRKRVEVRRDEGEGRGGQREVKNKKKMHEGL